MAFLEQWFSSCHSCIRARFVVPTTNGCPASRFFHLESYFLFSLERHETSHGFQCCMLHQISYKSSMKFTTQSPACMDSAVWERCNKFQLIYFLLTLPHVNEHRWIKKKEIYEVASLQLPVWIPQCMPPPSLCGCSSLPPTGRLSHAGYWLGIHLRKLESSVWLCFQSHKGLSAQIVLLESW